MSDHDHTPRPAVMGLMGMAVGFGIIGVSIGFATLLGIAATASGGDDTTDYGPMAVTAASSLVLGLLLIGGAVLLWRAHRTARVVVGAAVALLAVSSLVRVILDSITFVSVLGSVLTVLALLAMGYLLATDSVRDHVRGGVPMRLR